MGIVLGIKPGAISVENFRGKIRLRWTFNGKRHSLSTGLSYNDEGSKLVQKKVGEIYEDIKNNCFDSTLVKYKNRKPATEASVPYINLYEKWVTKIIHQNLELNPNYYGIRSLMKKWEDGWTYNDVIVLLEKETFSGHIYIFYLFFKFSKKFMVSIPSA